MSLWHRRLPAGPPSGRGVAAPPGTSAAAIAGKLSVLPVLAACCVLQVTSCQQRHAEAAAGGWAYAAGVAGIKHKSRGSGCTLAQAKPQHKQWGKAQQSGRACRGRVMRPEASSVISFHCAIHPTVLATAKSTVNCGTGTPVSAVRFRPLPGSSLRRTMETGMPSALSTMPEGSASHSTRP